MSSKRGAVKPSECENVASRSKKASFSTMDFIREVKFFHYEKKINARGLTVALTKF